MDLVSIVIPTLNEELSITACLSSVISQSYPKDKIEVIIADGGSTDNTINLVNQFKEKIKIIIVENEKKYQNIGLNKALEVSTGSIILRLDGHCQISSEYISTACELLNMKGNQYSAIGGKLITKPQKTTTFFGSAISLALSTKFGVGNSLFRIYNNKDLISVDTVSFACYKRSVFDKIGNYDSNYINSEDYEFHSRMRANNMKIGMTGNIYSTYFSRTELLGFIRHAFRNGRWSIIPMYLSKSYNMSIRHMVPLVFVLSLLILIISLSLGFHESAYVLLFEVLLYSSFLTYFSIFSIKKTSIKVRLRLMFIYPLLHIVYGMGSLCALIMLPIYKLFKVKII